MARRRWRQHHRHTQGLSARPNSEHESEGTVRCRRRCGTGRVRAGPGRYGGAWSGTPPPTWGAGIVGGGGLTCLTEAQHSEIGQVLDRIISTSDPCLAHSEHNERLSGARCAGVEPAGARPRQTPRTEAGVWGSSPGSFVACGAHPAHSVVCERLECADSDSRGTSRCLQDDLHRSGPGSRQDRSERCVARCWASWWRQERRVVALGSRATTWSATSHRARRTRLPRRAGQGRRLRTGRLGRDVVLVPARWCRSVPWFRRFSAGADRQWGLRLRARAGRAPALLSTTGREESRGGGGAGRTAR